MKTDALPTAAIRIDKHFVRFAGRTLVNFAGCDYFRFASHPKILAALHAGVSRFGLNVAASRKTTGNHELYTILETALARYFGAKAAVFVPTGYLANLIVAQALAGEFTHAFIDARAHASLRDAARHLECPVIQFAHRDPVHLQAQLKCARNAGPVLVLTDGMFAHDGSIAPLREYLNVLPRNGMLLVDDAHGVGVLGKQGRGAVEFSRIFRDRVLQTATLSKAFGVYGGVIVGSRALRAKIFTRSRAFAGGTPLPLPLVNSALCSVRLMAANAKARTRLATNAAFLKTKLHSGGWPFPATPGPIVHYAPKNPRDADTLQRALTKAGIYAPCIQYADATETGYFRFALSSEHTRAQLKAMATVLLQHTKSR